MQVNGITDLFKITEEIIDKTSNNGTENVEVMVLLKYSVNFVTTLEMFLTNCEINLYLNCS